MAVLDKPKPQPESRWEGKDKKWDHDGKKADHDGKKKWDHDGKKGEYAEGKDKWDHDGNKEQDSGGKGQWGHEPDPGGQEWGNSHLPTADAGDDQLAATLSSLSAPDIVDYAIEHMDTSAAPDFGFDAPLDAYDASVA